jgi:two-component system response regulator HydG
MVDLADKILIVDDEANARELFSLWLEKEGYTVRACDNGDDGVELVRTWEPDLVVLDLKIPPGVWGGLDALEKIKAFDEEIPVVFVSNKADVKRAIQSIRMGAFDFIDKNDARDELRITVANALKIRHLEQKTVQLENRNRIYEDETKLRMGFGNLTGASEAMQHIYRTIEKVAPTDAAVLVTGETGTGKELVAGAIHYQSQRKNGPFIKMNCAALPETLLEDELFGHEKGAFTGAAERRPGRFELADGGTLFLDEIGDMSISTQAKVLRVLQEREFERVGGTKTIKVDVRIYCYK